MTNMLMWNLTHLKLEWQEEIHYQYSFALYMNISILQFINFSKIKYIGQPRVLLVLFREEVNLSPKIQKLDYFG